ncbi:dTDP-4-dehydrorhamnose reductase [Shewanella khirikhana]|uniref:SDR family oxidoreductase n=1 Tax=Shewanella khirikhana TaxID=1965282 RepID=UPI0030D47374
MKVLLLGASGQVGRVLQASKPLSWKVLTPSKDEVDFLTPQSIADYLSFHRPQLVINCAAYTAVDKAESEPALCGQINADACGYLARATTAIDAALIHISTDYVFDGQMCRPYREDDTPAPLSVYGQTKWLGEQLIAKHSSRYIIIRTSWVFSSEGKNFVNSVLRMAASKPEPESESESESESEAEAEATLRIVADQIGAPTPATELAKAIWQLSRHAMADNCPWGTYHFSGQPFVSWYEFAEVIFAEAYRLGVAGRCPQLIPISTEDFQTLAQRPANSRLDSSKIETAFGIKAADWRSELTKQLELKARAAD